MLTKKTNKVRVFLKSTMCRSIELYKHLSIDVVQDAENGSPGGQP